MRLLINPRLRAVLLAVCLITTSYTLPQAYAAGDGGTDTTLSVLNAEDLLGLYPRGSAYQLEPISVTGGYWTTGVDKYVFDSATGTLATVGYNVRYKDTLGGVGAGDTETIKLSFRIESGTQRLYLEETPPRYYRDIEFNYTLADSVIDLNNRTTDYSASHYNMNIADRQTGGALVSISSPAAAINISGDYINNGLDTILTSTKGGAMYLEDGNYGNIQGHFITNLVKGANLSGGGAISLKEITVNRIVGDFIANAVSLSSESATASVTMYGGAAYFDNTEIAELTGDFMQNNITAYNKTNSAYAHGAALFLSETKITNLRGDFLQNFVKLTSLREDTGAASGYGGAISMVGNKSEIGTLIGDFTGNSLQSNITLENSKVGIITSGGSIYMTSTSKIGSITGDFIANSTEANAKLGSSYAIGGAITVSSQASIGSLDGDFIYNSASASSTGTSSTSARGGALALETDESVVGTITGSFYANHAISNKTGGLFSGAFGGAISNRGGSLGLLALDKDVVFTGNYTIDPSHEGKVFNAIYNSIASAGDDAHIRLNAYNGKRVIINDGITGSADGVASQIIEINRGLSGSGDAISAGSNYSTVEFNSLVENQNITVYAGVLEFGSFAGTTLTLPKGESLVVAATEARLLSSTLTINEGARVDAIATALSDGSTITNHGTLNLTTGTLGATLQGTGTAYVLDGSTVESSADNFKGLYVDVLGELNLTTGTLASSFSANSNVNIMAGSIVSSHTSYISTTDYLTVNGTLNLTGGTLSKKISAATGTVSIAAEATVESVAGNFWVESLAVDGTLKLTSGTISLQNDANLTVGGTLQISGNVAMSEAFSGAGTLKVDETATFTINASTDMLSHVTNDGTLILDKWIKNLGTVYGTGHLVSNLRANVTSDFYNSTNTIENNGTLNLVTGTLDMEITGSGTLSISNGIKLTTSANFNGITNKVYNSGELHLTTGTLTKLIGGIPTGKIFIGKDQEVGMHLDMLETENDIILSGQLYLSGTGTLEKLIDDNDNVGDAGSGTLHITAGSDISSELYYLKSQTNISGDLTMTNAFGESTLVAGMTGTGSLTVNSGTSFAALADNLGMANLHNSGTITLTGGTLNTKLLDNGTVIIDRNKTVTMNADVLDTGNTITNNGTLALSGGELSKNVGGYGSLIITQGGSVKMDSSYLNDYNKVTADGLLQITAGNIAKEITGKGVVSIENATTLSSNLSISGIEFNIDDTKSGKLFVEDNVQLDVSSYIMNLNGNVSLAENFLTWETGAIVADRAEVQKRFQLTVNGVYNAFVNIHQNGNSYSLSTVEVEAFNPDAGYYLKDYVDASSGSKFIINDYSYNADDASLSQTRTHVEYSGSLGDDYSKAPEVGAESYAGNFRWELDTEGHIYLHELADQNDQADFRAYSRDNSKLSIRESVADIQRSFIGKKSDSERIFNVNSSGLQIGTISGDYVANSLSSEDIASSETYGGVMYLTAESTIEHFVGDFVGNSVDMRTTLNTLTSRGGAIAASSITIDQITGNFLANYSSAHGASTSHTSSAQYATIAYGGAIEMGVSAHIGTITGDFVGNYALAKTDTTNFEKVEARGGAIALTKEASIGTIEGAFKQNYTAAAHISQGGAIYANVSSSIDHIKGVFAGNYATTKVQGYEGYTGYNGYKIAQGGAIFLEQSKISKIEANFYSNQAISDKEARGGAITNADGRLHDLNTTIKGDFVANAAISDNIALGGALYTAFAHNLSTTPDVSSESAFFNMQLSMDYAITGNFYGNYASGASVAKGGAMYNWASFTTLLAKDQSITFEGNYITQDGGATKVYSAIQNEAYDHRGFTVGSSASIINFEAYGNNKIIVNDGISGASTAGEDISWRNFQVLNINLLANNASTGSSETYSTVEFNNKVNDQRIGVYGGELKLGSYTGSRAPHSQADLERVTLTVYNSAHVEAVRADSLGDGDNNIRVTETGTMDLESGKLSNDILVDLQGLLTIKNGVTIDSILTVKDQGNLRGSLGLNTRLQGVTLDVNSKIIGQAITMEDGTINFDSMSAVGMAEVDGKTYSYTTVSVEADIYEVTGSLMLNINILDESAEVARLSSLSIGDALLLKDYEGMIMDIFAEDYDFETAVTININGSIIGVNAAHGYDNGILLVMVPEPSTATLSLLALAGLLARRRRKK